MHEKQEINSLSLPVVFSRAQDSANFEGFPAPLHSRNFALITNQKSSLHVGCTCFACALPVCLISELMALFLPIVKTPNQYLSWLQVIDQLA